MSLESRAGKPERKVYGVTELTRRIKSTLEGAFGMVWVEGELSNVRRPASGHYYFTIKDESAQISAVLFRGSQGGHQFQPKDGLLVRAYGQVTVYERGGNYQILVRKMEEGGQGSLQQQLEELKKKLHQEGLFDTERKRALPTFPQRIGVVTSRTGAAIRDILNVLSRRFPNLHLVLAPVKVQGEGAAAEIAAGIDALNRFAGPDASGPLRLDVLIVGRGGGSVEDLWCFNEEIVARAIARSGIPVISAVGHEIDFTISDFVADLRAPTPSAAAELVVGRKDAIEEALAVRRVALGRALRECLLRARSRFNDAARSYVFREPRNLVRQHAQRLDALKVRMEHEVRGGLREGMQRLDDSGVRMLHAVTLRAESRRQDVRRLEAQLRSLNPLAVLQRGYSVTRNASGEVIRAAADVKAGDRVTTQLGEGTIAADVVATDGA